MNWEAVTALSTLFTGVVFLVTVFVGARQLVQLRKATQLEGTMKIADQLLDPKYQRGLSFIFYDLPLRLDDEAFRHDWYAGKVLAFDQDKHPEVHVLMMHELIGTYVKEGLVDGGTIFELCGGRLIKSWEGLKPLIVPLRERTGDTEAWENNEYLAESARRWAAKK